MNWQPRLQPRSELLDAGRWHSENTFNLSEVAEQRQDNVFDESAFERAFDAARTEVESSTSKGKGRAIDIEQPKFDMSHACTDPGDITGEYDFDNVELLSADHRSMETTKTLQNQTREDIGYYDSAAVDDDRLRIGSDTIPAQSSPDPLTADAKADELARTAGQLLDNLKHEQSEKFRQSNFLELMRQLRDKEVQVEGEEITVSAPFVL